MSKILKAKKWLTLEDAAKRISISLGDDVRPVDLLQFALDGQLTLSVNFVNDAIGYEAIKPDEPSAVILAAIRMAASMAKAPKPPAGSKALHSEVLGKWYAKFIKNTYGLNEHQIAESIQGLHKTGDLLRISGVWDLPMIGAEILEVQDAMLEMMDVSCIEMTNIDGCFVESKDGRIVQLHAEFSDYEDTKEQEGTFPRSNLPPGTMFVMRPESISTFEASLADSDDQATDHNTGSKKDETAQRMLAGLALVLAEKGGKYKRGENPNYSQISQEIEAVCKSIPNADTFGLSPENIRKFISQGLALLGNS